MEYRKSIHGTGDGSVKYLPSENDGGRGDEAAVTVRSDNSDVVVYKIQILAGRSKLSSNSSEFKGLKGVERYKDGRTYKYMYGATTDRKEAARTLRKVKRKFKDAFIVTFKNGELE